MKELTGHGFMGPGGGGLELDGVVDVGVDVVDVGATDATILGRISKTMHPSVTVPPCFKL